jgi:RNA polymerase sigma-70 factor (ECF subfamily)
MQTHVGVYDGSQLAGVFREVSPELTASLFRVLHDWDEARDAAQTAFLRCWRAQDRLDAVRDVRAWLFRIAFNVALDRRRQLERQRAAPLDEFADAVPARPGASAEEEAIRREWLTLLEEALRELRPAEREVFVLRQQAGLTYREIAAARGQPVGTIKTLMHAAVRKLCARFADYRAA